MANVDLRAPSVVTDAFRARIASALAPLGFAVRAKALVRKRGKVTHRIAFSSSHRNVAGQVACWIAPTVEDPTVAKGWFAGGPLGGPAFAESVDANVARSDDADRLFARVLELPAFFEQFDVPAQVFAEVRRRYVPGFVDPTTVAPFLRVRLGADAVVGYASALLAARAELWPAFVTRGDERAGNLALADHGTQLAAALSEAERAACPLPPSDLVASPDASARHLRSFFGLQLRAWGEHDAAGALRRVGDDALQRAFADQRADPTPVVDSIAAAERVLALATGERRPPTRTTPAPRHFQYPVLHPPFVTDRTTQ